jgi:hypothetical protein
MERSPMHQNTCTASFVGCKKWGSMTATHNLCSHFVFMMLSSELLKPGIWHFCMEVHHRHNHNLCIKHVYIWTIKSRDSSVSIVTGYRLDDQGVGVPSPGGGKNFHFSMSSRPAPGSTQPPIQWVSVALSLEVKRQGHEADHWPPSSAEVKVMWIYTSTPPYTFRDFTIMNNTQVLVEVVTHLTCIQEVSSSHLSWNTDCSACMFLWFSSVPSGKHHENNLN